MMHPFDLAEQLENYELEDLVEIMNKIKDEIDDDAYNEIVKVITEHI